MAPAGDLRPARQVAVIDVGSNSIRLVVYRIEGRAIWTVYNEKVLAGLGRDMPLTGRLSPAGVADALNALRRFRAVLDGVRPDEILTAATAAVREAEDRGSFLERVAAETGFELRVLSGEDEARLAALGVLAGAPGARGLVGDLGGSSLELVRIEAGSPGRGITLPLGPFALQAKKPFDVVAVGLACDAVLQPHRTRFRSATFHAVGGAWRNIALVHMNLAGYPLHVLHQYEMGAGEALEVCAFVARQSKGSLERIPGLSKKRADTLPLAAVVLHRLILALDIETVSISAFGVREGLLFETLGPDARREDPLVAGCATLGGRERAADEFAEALETWLAPLWAARPRPFGEERHPILLAAACQLSSLGAHLHPDHRAELAFDLVLRAPIPGQSHRERAFLAAAVFARYSASGVLPEPEALSRLLGGEVLGQARALGAALRLGCDLSGRSPVLLSASSLRSERGELILGVEAGCADMVLGEQISKRAAQLGAALALPWRVALSPEAAPRSP